MSFVAVAWVCITPIINTCDLMVVKTTFATNAECQQKLSDMKAVLDKNKRIYSLFCYPVKPAKIAL